MVVEIEHTVADRNQTSLLSACINTIKLPYVLFLQAKVATLNGVLLLNSCSPC